MRSLQYWKMETPVLLKFTAVGLAVTKYATLSCTNIPISDTCLKSLLWSSTARLKHPTMAIAGAPLT